MKVLKIILISKQTTIEYWYLLHCIAVFGVRELWESFVMWQSSAFILSQSSSFHHSIPPLCQRHS